MSESCDSKCQFYSLTISDFVLLLCSFILSHPLYFLYLLFLSPYLLKLISFLSPLFVTTFLLFLAFLVHTESTQSCFTPILERLRFNKDCPNEEDSDDLEIFEIVFGDSPSVAASSVRENVPPSEFLEEKDNLSEPNQFLGSEKEDPSKNSCVVMEEKRLENFLKILDEFERLASNVEEKKKKKKLEPSRGAKSEKVVEKQNSLLRRNGSEADNPKIIMGKAKEKEKEKWTSQSQRIMSSDEWKSSLDSGGGSMRREREWKRTLACKLFEERHNAGGGEGMDSLWEAHEMEYSSKSSKKVGREMEEEDEEVGGAQLCCLQALKLSAGKMNLGVGRPNLVKISKAIKGIGWLHKLSKNSKKVHSNGDS